MFSEKFMIWNLLFNSFSIKFFPLIHNKKRKLFVLVFLEHFMQTELKLNSQIKIPRFKLQVQMPVCFWISSDISIFYAGGA